MKDTITITVKGMVCDRCKKVITKGMQSLGLQVDHINLGSITLSGTSKFSTTDPIRQLLAESGFDLLTDRNTLMVVEIKRLVEEEMNLAQEAIERPKISNLLRDKFPLAHDTISAIFSSYEGITLEKYIINKRMEKVKELLVYTDHTLTEIAFQTGFSNVFHLSNQFKNLTGLSPSHFREIRISKKQLTDAATRKVIP